MSFTGDISKWSKKAQERVLKVKKESAFDLFSSIIIGTPVDKGFLINNWFASSAVPFLEIHKHAGPTGGAAISRTRAVLKENTLGVPLYLTNNLPYAKRIEYEGHSAKAKNGMVRINLARWTTIVENNARRIAK